MGRCRRAHRPRPPPAVDHRPGRRRRASRWRTRTARCGSSSTAKSTITPSCGASCRRAGRPPLEHRSLRHRSHPARIRGVGHRRAARGCAACSRSRCGTRARERCGWCAIASASSRSTTASTTAGLTFASEIKALLEVPGQRRAVHEEALFHYLSFLTTPGTQTLFDGIQKLAPGTLAARQQRRAIDPAALLGRLGCTRGRSSRRPTTSSVSRSSRSCANRCSCARSATFPSACFCPAASTRAPMPRCSPRANRGRCAPSRSATTAITPSYANELHHARAMAERIGADHHERRLTRRRRHRLPAADGAPAGRADRRPGLRAGLLRRQAGARQHDTTVCQLGEGADEMFIGYPNWLQALERQQTRRSARCRAS